MTDLEQLLESHIFVLRGAVKELRAELESIAQVMMTCFRGGGKILLCGNGGSAADAQHVAAEFINRFRYDRPPLPAIALTTDTSVLTAIGNDSDFAHVFSRQVAALGRPGDLLVAISTSGKSPNVLAAVEVARANDLKTIAFTGTAGLASLGAKCDYCVVIPSDDTARIQEAHLFLWHFLCGEIEMQLFPKEGGVAAKDK